MNKPTTAVLWIIVDEARLETGLWCDRCLKPSGWRAPLLAMTEHGVGPIGAVARCYDADHPLTVEAP